MHIKLTETCYIESKFVVLIRLIERYGQPWVEVVTNRQDLCELNFRGEEAPEAWGNWQAYMREAEAIRRGDEEGAVPKIESRTKSEDNEQ
jgi:hypothetical protein